MNRTLRLTCVLLTALTSTINVCAQASWYSKNQSRIDTLRRGPFTLKISDAAGNPLSNDSVRIQLANHEFSWGTAYDLSTNSSVSTTSYSTSSSATVTSDYGDPIVYRTERYGKYFAYNLPADSGVTYHLTLKMAETYFNKANARIFDVYVDGMRVLSNVDVFSIAGGENIAYDATFDVVAASSTIKVEFKALTDNACIKGIALVSDNSELYINCGGGAVKGTNHAWAADKLYTSAASSHFNSSNDWNRSLILRYTNFGVCGNQFKWSGIEPGGQGQLNYAPFDNTYNLFTSMGLPVKGHCLLWGANNVTDYHCIPQWVMNLKNDPKSMLAACETRVRREVKRYKGKVKEYDVLNEPTHANYIQNNFVGDSLDWLCFKWAHEEDPNARLFVNDYNIIEWQNQTDDFCNLVRKMLANGAPVTGIGAQCHIGDHVDYTSSTNFKTRFDELAQFNLPIKITEFDMGAKSLTEQQYATQIATMMRLCFSHPAIEGFIFWGLQEPTWVPESIVNIIREDNTPKLAADTVYNLVHKTWSTNLIAKTFSDGTLDFKGYYGDYDITVKVGDAWERHTVSCRKSAKGSTIPITMGSDVNLSPRLLNVKIAGPQKIELQFDKAMKLPSTYAGFKIFDSNLNYISGISLKENNPQVIVLQTAARMSAHDYIPVSYLATSGTVNSVDGGVLKPFGLTVPDSVTYAFVSAKTTTIGSNVVLYFNHKIEAKSINASDFNVLCNGKMMEISKAVQTGYYMVNLTLSGKIAKGDIVTVSYNPGDLSTAEGSYVSSFIGQTVENVSTTTGISTIPEDYSAHFHVTCSPNPCTDYLTISGCLPYSTLSIFDMSGRLLQRQSIKDNTVNVFTANLVNGAYIVHLSSEGKNGESHRFIKK